MTGFGLLLRKELLEQVRTMRLFVVAIVFALFGALSPVLARYTPEILKAVAGDQLDLVGLIPTPTTADAIVQFLKNLGQFGALAAILLAMGAVAAEKERGTAALLLTKPASRAAFLVAKLVAISANLFVAVVVAGVFGYYYTLVLFEPLPVGGYLAMCVVLWLSLVVYASLTLLGSTLTRSTAAGAGVGFVFLVVTGIVSVLPRVGAYMPESLSTPAMALALGNRVGNVLGPVAVNVGMVAAAGVLAWVVFRRQEL